MVSTHDIESAKLCMLQARKELEDYETRKGHATCTEHIRHGRAFIRHNLTEVAERLRSLVAMYASRFRNCASTKRDRICGARKKWGSQRLRRPHDGKFMRRSSFWKRGPERGDYFSFAYSALACLRMGMSGSASFQRVRKS
jgi:hypothetical protein